MGLLVLKSKMCSEMDLNIKEKQYFRKQNVHTQVLFLTFHSYNLETAFLYIRETPNQEETKILKKDLEKVDLVMGDLNIDADDPKRIADKKKLDTLCVKRTRILMEVTTTHYNKLDHILLNIEKFPVFYSFRCLKISGLEVIKNCVVFLQNLLFYKPQHRLHSKTSTKLNSSNTNTTTDPFTKINIFEQ